MSKERILKKLTSSDHLLSAKNLYNVIISVHTLSTIVCVFCIVYCACVSVCVYVYMYVRVCVQVCVECVCVHVCGGVHTHMEARSCFWIYFFVILFFFLEKGSLTEPQTPCLAKVSS